MKEHELVRVRRGKVIAGVCGGIARRYGWSPTLVRLAFIVSCVLPGPQVLAYVVLWILIPQEDEASTLGTVS
jgi:phage shock protein PspC (stress-responsive transcriptional regulator)